MIQETFSEHNCICRTLIDIDEMKENGLVSGESGR